MIVLLHGYPQRASSWDLGTPLLNEAGYRTIAFDQRGYAPGARPRGRKAYRVANLAADVIALIDALQEQSVHLVGHDWGSFVGWTVCGYYPDRIRSYTSISLPHPLAFKRSLFTSKQALHSWYMLFFQLPVLPEVMMSRWDGIRNKQLRDSRMSEEMIRRYEQEMVVEGALQGGINWYRAFPYFGKAKISQVPTTHIWGTDDNSLERKGAEYCQDYVQADYKLEIIEGGSHWLPDERPREIARIILVRVRSIKSMASNM